MDTSTSLVRDAFDRAGEKRFLLARPLYYTLFGVEWTKAILGFSYLKCLDDLVDEDPDVDRALAVLARQRQMIAAIYDGGDVAQDLASPEIYGAPFFAHDRDRGAPLRATFEKVLATMDFDTRRRGKILDAASLDAYVVELGSAALHFLAHFAAPGFEAPAEFVAQSSRAYLMADALIDLRHDLAAGVINVSREDIDRFGLSLEDDRHLRTWMARQGPLVDRLFEEVAQLRRRLQSRPLRLLTVLYLSSKRRSLRRFLVREGL